MAETWLKCSACRTEIAFNAVHWVCSVSTCNRNRTRLVFCSVACWDSHVAMLRHREAWAVEARAPNREAWARELAAEAEAAKSEPAKVAVQVPARTPASMSSGRRVIGEPMSPSSPSVISRPAETSSSSPSSSMTARPTGPSTIPSGGPTAAPVTFANAEREMLIVISKLKKYVKDRAGMNCSDAIAEVLSDHVRALCDDAIRAAGRDERKTVLERDLPRPRR